VSDCSVQPNSQPGGTPLAGYSRELIKLTSKTCEAEKVLHRGVN